jgi:hypothetical protein
MRDRQLLAATSDLASAEQALVLAFVERPDFLREYPNGMTAEQFVDALMTSTSHSGIALSSERAGLLKLYDGTNAGRTAIIRRLVDDPGFKQAEYNRAFVLTQYFSYLRHDPDDKGYESSLNALNSKIPNQITDYKAVICRFISSKEYQLRFGMLTPHTEADCAISSSKVGMLTQEY